jgi:cell division protein FtsB
VQNRPRRVQNMVSNESSNANVTTAVGMEESAGHRRARKNSFFTRTVMWVTGLICTAFLLGTLAQAWSNSNLFQQVQYEQQNLQQVKQHHQELNRLAAQGKDPAEIESTARQELGYIRPGEHPVIIVSPPQKNPVQGAPKQDSGRNGGIAFLVDR